MSEPGNKTSETQPNRKSWRDRYIGEQIDAATEPPEADDPNPGKEAVI